jgi:apolipoprotein D and lipocalin family protein
MNKGVVLWCLGFMLLISACSQMPDNVQPVTNFQVDRYLGRWYEIARLDHSFERGLERVTAQYALREDGGVRVVNRGFDPQKQAWDEAVGKAYFVGDKDVGQLKVSFFGPFYGGYNIIVLDEDYQYAMVCGPDRSYLWILARSPRLDESTLQRLVDTAKSLGFATEELIYVAQE